MVGAALICAGSASLAIFELRSMVFSYGDQKLTRLTFTWLSGDNAKNALEDVRKRFRLRTLGGSIDEKGIFCMMGTNWTCMDLRSSNEGR